MAMIKAEAQKAAARAQIEFEQQQSAQAMQQAAQAEDFLFAQRMQATDPTLFDANGEFQTRDCAGCAGLR